MKLLALLGGAGVDKDPFAQGFRAFKKALSADDPVRGKEALRLMVEACKDDGEEEEEEGEGY